ncbi:MAG TPA: serine/threonine-protein kinase, partial [Planctomycetota bacterium]|nr:serine/threonine-protein kinase [Planctomycetota bacterium]
MTFAQPFKDYEILERIGAGAMGTVFKARQKRLDRIVALKVLKPSLARNTKFVERLRREARIVASLNHPDIVAGYDLGEEGGYHFFVMEFVEGRSLAALLKEWGSFPEHQVLDVAVRVASALDHAFQKGVIHRDVKPGNILIDASGRAKLTDMGLAKAPEDASLTQDGATVGTPQYISPEQARDPSKVDVRSDLYSLGATMFHMCTGQPPFPGSTVGNVIHDVIHRRAPSPRTINPGISPGLDLVIRKLLQKEPKARYQTPAELLADLERVRRAEPPHVDERALERGDGRRARLRFGPWAWAAVTAVVAALGAAWWWWPEPTRGRDATEPQHAFVQRVRASVDAAGDVRGKLRALAVASAEAATDRHRRAIDELR